VWERIQKRAIFNSTSNTILKKYGLDQLAAAQVATLVIFVVFCNHCMSVKVSVNMCLMGDILGQDEFKQTLFPCANVMTLSIHSRFSSYASVRLHYLRSSMVVQYQ